jgi:hypothetical protein
MEKNKIHFYKIERENGRIRTSGAPLFWTKLEDMRVKVHPLL